MGNYTHKSFDFELKGTEFFGQYWQPEKTDAVLILVHGMGEHSGRYEGIFTDSFLANNIAVMAFDQFGHGKTKGKRGHTPGYECNLDSIAKMQEICVDTFGAVPYFVYGHSMGGNLVSNFVLKRESAMAGAIISSPMLRLAFVPPAWKLKVGGLLRNVLPSFTEKTGLDANKISRIPEEIEKYKSDSLVHDKVSINYSLPFFEAGEWAIANAGSLKKDVFIFHGTGDGITDHKASVLFAKNAGEKATLKLYEGGYHELHNDICQKEVLDDIVAWMISKLNA